MDRGIERRIEPGTGVRPPPGEILPGTRYRLLAKLGQGAMGVVYAAEHVELEKRVALKLLLGGIARKPDAIERFRQEARAASRIGNPYICDVTDFGQLPDGRVFFVMEYLEGRSLRRVLDAGPLDPARLIPILRQIAKALGAAHDKRIVHLDVKPDNVMVLEGAARPDAVKVVDFGIAELLRHQQTQRRQVTGTPAYIAPERAMGRAYDHRADVYSLGVVAYEALSGSVPFREDDDGELMKRHVVEAPAPLRAQAAGRVIPPDLEALVMQMLEKDPDARPQSMAVVEAMLCEAQIAAGLTTTWDDLELPAVDEAWRAKLGARMPSPRGRQRKAMLLAAVSAAVLASAAALYFGLVQEPREVEVKVLVTGTDEVPAVAEWLKLADAAERAQRYVTPGQDSALYYLQRAEEEAAKARRRSAGAEKLRRRFARALARNGEELEKFALGELAATKYEQALLFEPGDRTLAARVPASARQRRPGPVEAKPTGGASEERARTAAADLFLAAKERRFTEARRQLAALTENDPARAHAAKLADAVRELATDAWGGRRAEESRALHALVAELDPQDRVARERADRDPPPVAAPAPPPPLPPAAVSAKAAATAPADTSAGEEPAVGRDVNGSKQAARIGQEALAKGRLAEADAAFARALRADPMNPVAVGGVAEVAFERARYTEALDYARRAVKLAPKSSRYHLVLGDAYFKLLRYREAQSAYGKALLHAPGDERVRGRLDRVRAKLGK